MRCLQRAQAAPPLLDAGPSPNRRGNFAPQDGDRFWRMPEAYIRGNTIK